MQSRRVVWFRSLAAGFTPILDGWFEATNPEELADALQRKLQATSKGPPKY